MACGRRKRSGVPMDRLLPCDGKKGGRGAARTSKSSPLWAAAAASGPSWSCGNACCEMRRACGADEPAMPTMDWLRAGCAGVNADSCDDGDEASVSIEVDDRTDEKAPSDETDSLRLLLIGDERAYGVKRALLSEADDEDRLMAGAGVTGCREAAASSAADAAAAALALDALTLSPPLAACAWLMFFDRSRFSRACRLSKEKRRERGSVSNGSFAPARSRERRARGRTRSSSS